MKDPAPSRKATLAKEHFSDLAGIAMHYSYRISVDEISHAFVQAYPRRHRNLLTDRHDNLVCHLYITCCIK